MPNRSSSSENPDEEFALLQTEWYNHHAPAKPEERLQVDTLIRSEWFLRRYFRVEAQLWENHSMKASKPSRNPRKPKPKLNNWVRSSPSP